MTAIAEPAKRSGLWVPLDRGFEEPTFRQVTVLAHAPTVLRRFETSHRHCRPTGVIRDARKPTIPLRGRRDISIAEYLIHTSQVQIHE